MFMLSLQLLQASLFLCSFYIRIQNVRNECKHLKVSSLYGRINSFIHKGFLFI